VRIGSRRERSRVAGGSRLRRSISPVRASIAPRSSRCAASIHGVVDQSRHRISDRHHLVLGISRSDQSTSRKAIVDEAWRLGADGSIADDDIERFRSRVTSAPTTIGPCC
jgi:hypothetical protein